MFMNHLQSPIPADILTDHPEEQAVKKPNTISPQGSQTVGTVSKSNAIRVVVGILLMVWLMMI